MRLLSLTLDKLGLVLLSWESTTMMENPMSKKAPRGYVLVRVRPRGREGGNLDLVGCVTDVRTGFTQLCNVEGTVAFVTGLSKQGVKVRFHDDRLTNGVRSQCHYVR